MRPKLQNMPCSLVDAIFVTQFDPASLSNRLSDAGFPVGRCCPSTDIYLWAHALIHREEEAAYWFENFLDRMHLAQVIEVSQTDSELIETWCELADWRSTPNLAGRLWALARDPRLAVQKAVKKLVWRISMSSFRSPIQNHSPIEALSPEVE